MAVFDPHRYRRVDQKSEHDGHLSDGQSLTSGDTRINRITVALLVLVVVISAATVSGVVFNRDSAHKNDTMASTQIPESPYRPCGQNHTDASSAGCVYDVMMNSWLPKDCYDEDLSADFWSLRDWSFYIDAEGTLPLSVEDLSQRKQAHATLEYHFVHCIYSLRKVQRAFATGRHIEEDTASMDHDHHCSAILQRGVREMEYGVLLSEVRTTLNVAYPRCVSPAELLAKSKHDSGHGY